MFSVSFRYFQARRTRLNELLMRNNDPYGVNIEMQAMKSNCHIDFMQNSGSPEMQAAARNVIKQFFSDDPDTVTAAWQNVMETVVVKKLSMQDSRPGLAGK